MRHVGKRGESTGTLWEREALASSACRQPKNVGVTLARHVEEDLEFEFERKFLVRNLPAEVTEHGTQQAIVQAYVFAEEGYAVRVRITFPGVAAELPDFNEEIDFLGAYERRVLSGLLKEHEPQASIAVKSPSVAAERYEMEQHIDPDVATQILRRCPNSILKNRYSFWYDEDGWEFDIFAGQNRGLIIAECERMTPVVGLKIPQYCVTEVSDDLRFTNDYLSKSPWRQWADSYGAELEARGPHFMTM